MAALKISLTTVLTDAQQRAIGRYAQAPQTLSAEEWREVLTAFDRLRVCRVTWRGQTQTFAAFYETVIDRPYATRLLAALAQEIDVEAAGPRMVRRLGEEVWQTLRRLGLAEPLGLPERLLLAFCLYRWTSFAKGYLAEIAVYRDLEQSGIEFEAHDLADPRARYTPFDLSVSGPIGDVKASTYFLQVMRSFPLRHDFYLTRVFDPGPRRWHRAALLKEAAWQVLDGEPQPGRLSDAPRLWPQPVRIEVRGETLIVVDYEVWKDRVRRLQKGASHGSETP